MAPRSSAPTAGREEEEEEEEEETHSDEPSVCLCVCLKLLQKNTELKSLYGKKKNTHG